MILKKKKTEQDNCAGMNERAKKKRIWRTTWSWEKRASKRECKSERAKEGMREVRMSHVHTLIHTHTHTHSHIFMHKRSSTQYKNINVIIKLSNGKKKLQKTTESQAREYKHEQFRDKRR